MESIFARAQIAVTIPLGSRTIAPFPELSGFGTGKGAIFDTGFGVAHDFWKTYLLGNNHMILKFPTSEEFPYASGTRQNFKGGYMTRDPVTKVKVFQN